MRRRSPFAGLPSPFAGLPSPFPSSGRAAIDLYATDEFGASLRRTASATMVDSAGLVKWSPHNLAINSAVGATQSPAVVNGSTVTLAFEGTGSITYSGAAAGTLNGAGASALVSVALAMTTASLTLTVTGSITKLRLYRSDLDGMTNNPSTGDSYVPTAGAAVYLARWAHHIAAVLEGLLLEAAATNLFLNSTALSTQNVTTTAVPYTLSFYGTGTVTLTGTSVAGPLVGTGANNRVSLTFTPTAGALTCTVSGSVTRAQIEIGSTPSSYIPTFGATVSRAADLLNFSLASINLAGGYTVAVQSRIYGAPTTGNRVIQADTGSLVNPHFIGYTTTGPRVFVDFFNASASQAYYQAAVYTLGAQMAHAVRFAPNDFAAAISGSLSADDTACNYTAPTMLRLGNNIFGEQPPVMTIKRLQLFTRLVRGAALAALGTVQ